MKASILFLFALLLSVALKAQNKIQVSEHSTVHLMCPSAVNYVHVGSPSKLMAETVPNYPNIVRIKASEVFPDTSSLTLICGNQLYAFEITYNRQCSLQLKLYDYKGNDFKEWPGGSLPLHQMLASMHQLQAYTSKHKPVKSIQKNRIKLTLDDIRVRQDLLFIKLTIKNRSNLIYKAHTPTFLMRDKKPGKAVNVQEYAIEPIRTSASEVLISPQEEKTMVFVFKSFSIPKHKELEITLREETTAYTGRGLSLSFGNKAIVKAKIL